MIIPVVVDRHAGSPDLSLSNNRVYSNHSTLNEYN
jgi:hypothetical protein